MHTKIDCSAQEILSVPHQSAAVVEFSSVSSIQIEDSIATLGTAPNPQNDWWRRLSPSTIFILAAGAIAVFFLFHELFIAGKLGFPLDDAWSEQVYARNFFDRLSFEFNSGERTPGPTAPFWTVFLAIGFKVFHDPIVSGKLLGAIFLSLLGYYSYRLLRTTKFDHLSSILSGLLVITVGRIAWSELSGMESALSAALVIALLWVYVLPSTRLRPYVLGALGALAALVRPETAILFFLVLLHSLYWNFGRSREKSVHFWREWWLVIVTFTFILVPIALTNVAMSGAILPATYMAGISHDSLLLLLRHEQIGEILIRMIVCLRTFRYMMLGYFLIDNPVIFVLILWGLILLIKNKTTKRDANDKIFTLLVLMLIGFPYLRALFLGTDSEFGEHARWIHFLSPIYICAGIAGLRIVVRRYYLRGPDRKTFLFWSAGIALSIALATLALQGYFYLPVNHSLSSTLYSGFNEEKLVEQVSALDYVLLLCSTAVIVLFGIPYLSTHLWKREQKIEVLEEERYRITIETEDPLEASSDQPEYAMRFTHVAIMLVLVWNISSLSRSAREFGREVRNTNEVFIRSAKAITQITPPKATVATNALGAAGYFSDRHIYDTEGSFSMDANRNKRAMDKDQALFQTLLETRPQYFAAFGTEYASFMNSLVLSGFCQPIAARNMDLSAHLYQLDFSKVGEGKQLLH